MCVVLQIAEIPVKSERWDATAATAFVELQLPTVTVNIKSTWTGYFAQEGTALPLFPQRWALGFQLS
jgi:hypothetical protein